MDHGVVENELAGKGSGNQDPWQSAQDAQQAQQARLALAFDHVVDVVFLLNLHEDGRYSFASVNRRFFEVTGLPPESVVGRYVEEVLPPSAHELVFSNYDKAIRSRRPVSWEETSEYPTGTKIGEVTVAPVLEADGSCRQLVGVVHDITAQRHILATLEEVEERWRLALEGSGAGVWDWSVADNKVTLSPLWLSIIGHRNAELNQAYEEWVRRVHPKDKPAVLKILEDMQRDHGRSFHAEYRLRHQNSSWVWVRAHGIALYDRAGGLERLVGTITDISQQKRAEDIIWRQANFDSLTQLANRHRYVERLSSALEKADPLEEELTVLMVDLDRFKEINDSLGHSAGDRLLREAAQRLKAAVPNHADIARLGGDEFGVIARGSPSQAHAMALALTRALSEPYVLGDTTAHLTASTGMAHFPRDARDTEGLIMQADQAMYAAKAMGGNRVTRFEPGMQDRLNARQRLIADLHLAIRNEQLALRYQPIMDLRSGEVIKAEALIRWQHPTQGSISPSVFIPLAEDIGIIQQIGQWVLERALREFAPMMQGGCQLAINVSSHQFTDEGEFVQALLAQLERMNPAAPGLVVELTETVLLELTESKLRHFQRLANAGIQLALDDFGTGYSSLSYITRLKFDYLKIDRIFTLRMERDPTSRALCETMISLAHKLNMKVIAEGIETPAQLEMLRNAGCDLGQGYLFSQPLDIEAFSRFAAAAAKGAAS